MTQALSLSPRCGLALLVRTARRDLGASLAVLVATLGLLAFLAIADSVAEGKTKALDRAILMALRQPGRSHELIGPQWLPVAAMDVTALGSLTVLALLILLACVILAVLRRWGQALLLLICAGGGLALSQGLKAVFGRERPGPDYRALETINASFPSGHALLSAVVFLTLGAMVARFVQGRRLKALALALGAAIALSLLVGVSRIYLGVHWASDVLAGWSVGAAWAMACWLVAFVLTRWRSLRRPA